MLAAVRRHGLRSEEHGRHHELIAENDAVDDQVVPVDLPAPGGRSRRRAHHAEPVEPLAVFLPSAGDLADEVVQLHDVAHGREATLAQTRGQEREPALPLRRRQRIQQHAVAHEMGMDVAPPAPRVVVEREARPALLLTAERREKRRRRLDDRLRRHAGRCDGEQTSHRSAVLADAFERLRQRRLRVREIALQGLWKLFRRRARGDDRTRVTNVPRHRATALPADSSDRTPAS